ncbi:YdcF family protein [Pseudomonadota bacterium]
MRFDSEQSDIDWDGLWTLLLSFLVIIATAAIPLFLTYLHVLRIARNSPAHADSGGGCLVFGKKLMNGSVDNEYQLRLEKALQLILEQPRRLVLLLGGRTLADAPSEAESGLFYLQQYGLPEQNNIRLEEQSKNTLDNLQNARQMLQREQINQVALISNRYHLARCQLIANSLKIKHTLCAAEPALIINAVTLWKLLIEAAYIHWFVVGKNWARLIGNRRMLGRVT